MEQELVVPRSMFSYATSAPNMLATQTIVRAIQNGLVEIGCHVQPTGVMDMDTEACLQQIVGENWQHTSWYRVGKQIVNFRDTGRHAPSASQPLSGVESDKKTDMIRIALISGAAYATFRLWRKK